jgi:hypothetical protein
MRKVRGATPLGSIRSIRKTSLLLVRFEGLPRNTALIGSLPSLGDTPLRRQSIESGALVKQDHVGFASRNYECNSRRLHVFYIPESRTRGRDESASKLAK